MRHSAEYLEIVGKTFALPGRFEFAEPYGSGHINDTYRARWTTADGACDYIHKRINHEVFKEPLRLMENICRVTSHLRAKLAADGKADPSHATLTVMPARDGAACWRDADGNYWRTYLFINRAMTYDICPGIDFAREAARAFGKFQAGLADLPGPRLHDTIPWFHHTPRRFQALTDAVEQDPLQRAAAAGDAVEFCRRRREMVTRFTDLIESGAIPERIAHNDTKLNNVMMDNDTGRGVCVIDLDTVMTGSILYDFGDMVRSTTRTCDEDEPDPARVKLDLGLFRALAEGYLDTAGAFLTPAEREQLAFSGRLVTFTIGLRFLTDYLTGDRYFKTRRPGQNLDRARVQFRMVEHMEEAYPEMQRIVEECHAP